MEPTPPPPFATAPETAFEGPTRRQFVTAAAGGAAALWAGAAIAEEPKQTPSDQKTSDQTPSDPDSAAGPVEAAFVRDYDPPDFQPSWSKPQINRQLAQDFVVFAHIDRPMAEKLLDREPGLLNAAVDWGGGDWETALGGASHMGERDTVEMLLKRGARADLFCAAMLGQLAIVRGWIELQPSLIDATGPHGFTLHFHAQIGGDDAADTLAYLQEQKEVELPPLPPFLRK